MLEQDYSHRGVVDKLGVKAGYAVRIVEAAGPVHAELRAQILLRAGRREADDDEAPDLVIASVDARTDVLPVLKEWRQRIRPAGGIWLLTPKRGQPGYVKQDTLIEPGALAGLVDTKVCSVSDSTSAMRFVIRRKDRA